MQNLYSCPQDIKEAVYKGWVCPVLEYGSSVWDLKLLFFREKLKACKITLLNHTHFLQQGTTTMKLGE